MKIYISGLKKVWTCTVTDYYWSNERKNNEDVEEPINSLNSSPSFREGG